MLSCKQASQLLSQSLDRPLNWRERFSLKLHLMLCDVCIRFAKQLKMMQNAIKQMMIVAESDEQVSLPQSVHEKITNALNGQ